VNPRHLAYDQASDMSRVELRRWAGLLLADLDALEPGRSFTIRPTLPARDAYALQQEVVRLRERRGERVIGYKIGCSSRVIQKQLGTDQPIFGRIFDTGCFRSGSRLSYARFAGLAIEGELAIRLCRDLPGSPLPDEEYNAAIGSVFGTIELHHYGVYASGGSLPALIATSGMHAGLIPAAETTFDSARVHTVLDLTVSIDEQPVGTTGEPWSMGSPAAALRWFSPSLDEVGARLICGQVILTGAVLPLFPVRPGARVVVEARPLGRCVAEVDP
jgi:2-keto-4-pentenoate hydratase